MLTLHGIHHIAIICSDYEASKKFYTDVLGLTPIAEHHREERKSFKLDLSLNGEFTIELFSFPSPPARISNPEAAGLRHLAFSTDDLDGSVRALKTHNVNVEPIRNDPYTGKRFTFFRDPDNLPLELYEV